MSKLLCIGIATLDIINTVSAYPDEDDEIRIIAQHKRRGGNASNSAVILSQLGHQCYWTGTLVKEADTQIILDDFKRYRINYDYCDFQEQGKIPTSYISLSQQTGSRTISHYRDLPELSFEIFKTIPLKQFNWLHFEGRNIEQTLAMMTHAKQQYPDIPISLEIEKSRQDIEHLIPLADFIFFAKDYILRQGFESAEEFCKSVQSQYPDKIIFCAWGSSGAAALDAQNYHWQEAFSVTAIDTLAAGDVFNAAIIDQQLKQQNITKSLRFACQLAAQKCAHSGLDFIR